MPDAEHDAILDVRHDGTLDAGSDTGRDSGRDAVADSVTDAVDEAARAPNPTFRLIAPLSTSRVTRRRPTMRWVMPSGTPDAIVELCSDRACTMPVGAPVQVQGTSYAPTSDLPTGVVYWRVSASTMSGSTSATWELSVGPADTPVDSSWGTTLDVNGDGYADVVVSDTFYTLYAGSVSVYLGSAAGIRSTPDAVLAAPAGSVGFGSVVTSGGDVNGDGYADLVVGPYVYLGSATGVATTPSITLEYPKTHDVLMPIWGIGDVNGDGYADVYAAGDIAADAGTAEGDVFLYFGGVAGLATQPAVTWPVVYVPKPSGAVSYYFGWDCTDVGDVNGDGFDDVVVTVVGADLMRGVASLYLGSASGFPTAPVSSITQFGAIPDGDFDETHELGVIAAGDVNGDGYADVVFLTDVLGYPDYARASLFLGGAAGLGAVPATVVTLPNLNVASFASAGDVNGDGYGDVVFGASTSNAYIYLGSASGLTLAPASTLTGPVALDYGHVVASAGDVNGDGYADIVVGAPNESLHGDAGSAYVYLGSASGVATTPATTLAGPPDGGAAFGASVFGATN